MELENEIISENQEVTNTSDLNTDDENSIVSENDNAEVEDDQDENPNGEDDGIEKEMKTIKKALNKKNRYIDNQRSRIRALEAEIQKLQSQPVSGSENSPKMENFESVLDYIEAKQKFDLEQKFAEQGNQQQITALQQQQQAIRAQQEQQIEQEITELVSSNPEVKTLFESNLHIIDQMPPHVENLLYEIGDAVAATYALAKEGRLQDLYYMHPHVAAAELVQAQQRGRQYLERQSSSKTNVPLKEAPKPIGSIKGAGRPSKSIDKMTPEELVKRYIK